MHFKQLHYISTKSLKESLKLDIKIDIYGFLEMTMLVYFTVKEINPNRFRWRILSKKEILKTDPEFKSPGNKIFLHLCDDLEKTVSLMSLDTTDIPSFIMFLDNYFEKGSEAMIKEELRVKH